MGEDCESHPLNQDGYGALVYWLKKISNHGLFVLLENDQKKSQEKKIYSYGNSENNPKNSLIFLEGKSIFLNLANLMNPNQSYSSHS